MLDSELKEKLSSLSYEDMKEALSTMLRSVTSQENWDRKIKKAEKDEISSLSGDEKKSKLYQSLLKTSLLSGMKESIDKAIKFDDSVVDYTYDEYMDHDASNSEKEHERIESNNFVARRKRVQKKVLDKAHFVERFKNEEPVRKSVEYAISHELLSFTAYTTLVSAVNTSAKALGYIADAEQLVTGEEMTKVDFTSTIELCPLVAIEEEV